MTIQSPSNAPEENQDEVHRLRLFSMLICISVKIAGTLRIGRRYSTRNGKVDVCAEYLDTVLTAGWLQPSGGGC